MVARIVSGKSIRGILNYNENKVAHSEAQLLMAAGFAQAGCDLRFNDKLRRFEELTALNERTRTNALHITLNFSPRDKVDDNLLQLIALEYMEAIGFGRQPFLVYRHYDAAHPHIHIATVNIDSDGQRIETHNIGRNQSEKARKEIEITYGLVKAEEQKKDAQYMLHPVDLDQVIYGKRETKAAITAIVREVVDTYKFTSLPELNAILRQFNILAWPGAEGTLMRQMGGLVYCILDGKGEPVGIPIKASSIFSSPTLKNLEKKFVSGKEERKPYALRIKHLLDKALAGAKDTEDLTRRLREQGIRILFRENTAGQTYGITFIDNGTRSIFNGSDLGKPYAAKAFMERLGSLAVPAAELITEKNVPAKAGPQRPDTSSAVTEEKSAPIPATGLPVMEKVWDILMSDEHEAVAYDPYLGRKKKKKKIQPD